MIELAADAPAGRLRVDGAPGVTVVAAAAPSAPDPSDLAVLSPDELARMRQLARGVDAAAFARAHAVLRRLVAARDGWRTDAVPLVAGPGQAPRVDGSDLGCSLAHTDGLVLVAVAPGQRVGVDVEAVDPSLSTAEMAWIERELLDRAAADGAAGPEARDGDRRAFLRRWTRTEAVLKALGTGFGGDTAAPPGDAAGPRHAAAPALRVVDLDVGDRWTAALALAAPVATVLPVRSIGDASIAGHRAGWR